MFTGIVEGLGTVSALRPSGSEGKSVVIRTDLDLSDSRIGDSIAVNGVCLTATHLEVGKPSLFQADISPETLSRSTLGMLRIGDRVHLERALRLSDRIGGHLVSGHVDTVGRIRSVRRRGNALLMAFSIDPSLSKYIVEKGSIAIDGISLTVNQVREGEVEVSLIPHTADVTILAEKPVGTTVNIETDIIGKYVERLLTRSGSLRPKEGIGMDVLAKSGFLR